jgi:hypothetical protein
VHNDATTPVLASTLKHFLPQAFNEERVLSQEKGFEFLLNDNLSAGQWTTGGPGLADADKAIISFHLDQQAAARGLRPGCTHIGLFTTIGEWDRADIGNFHHNLPFSFVPRRSAPDHGASIRFLMPWHRREVKRALLRWGTRGEPMPWVV